MAACNQSAAEQEAAPTPAQTPDPQTPMDKAPAAPANPAPAKPAAAPPLAPLSSDKTRDYARRVVPMIAARTLKKEELAQIVAQAEKALPGLVDAWVQDPQFAEAARTMISLQLRASGKRDSVDLNLPGNLAAYLVREKKPWSGIVTSDQCVDATGKLIVCDTGAPFAAGVLATRAFMIGNAGRFNLRRARTVMETFACIDYPMPPDFQPRLDKGELLPMFQADTANEQTVEAARGTFGNGHACYTCHGQFGAHAQVFVKFDETGKWKETVTGLQDPKGEQGRSTGGLFASHFKEPGAAATEASQWFGKRVTTLREAALELAARPRFLPCATRTLLGYVFSLPESTTSEMPDSVIDQIVASAKARQAEPTLAALAAAALVHPSVVRSLVAP